MITSASVTLSVNGWQLLGLLVSTILPLIVGLVTTRVTGPHIKAVLLLALSAVTGLGTELLASHSAGQAYDLGTGLLTALTAFLIGVGMHFGLWKPTGTADAVQGVGSSS